jgi:hypothetical protein
MRGDSGHGLRQLRAGLGEFVAMSDSISLMFLNELAAGFARAGQIATGLTAAERAMQQAERTGARWLFPESLRIKGELLLLQAATGAVAAAEDHFRQALDLARQQGALSWELRAGTSMARLLRDQGRSAAAKALLQPIYARFTEGFETADRKAANALLDGLGQGGRADIWISSWSIVACTANCRLPIPIHWPASTPRRHRFCGRAATAGDDDLGLGARLHGVDEAREGGDRHRGGTGRGRSRRGSGMPRPFSGPPLTSSGAWEIEPVEGDCIRIYAHLTQLVGEFGIPLEFSWIAGMHGQSAHAILEA